MKFPWGWELDKWNNIDPNDYLKKPPKKSEYVNSEYACRECARLYWDKERDTYPEYLWFFEVFCRANNLSYSIRKNIDRVRIELKG